MLMTHTHTHWREWTCCGVCKLQCWRGVYVRFWPFIGLSSYDIIIKTAPSPWTTASEVILPISLPDVWVDCVISLSLTHTLPVSSYTISVETYFQDPRPKSPYSSEIANLSLQKEMRKGGSWSLHIDCLFFQFEFYIYITHTKLHMYSI